MQTAVQVLVLLTEHISYTRNRTRGQLCVRRSNGMLIRAQAGEETVTEMRHFMLAADGQLHDLHSKLRLDHPGGQATQLHKCIVSGSTGTLNALRCGPLCL